MGEILARLQLKGRRAAEQYAKRSGIQYAHLLKAVGAALRARPLHRGEIQRLYPDCTFYH